MLRRRFMRVAAGAAVGAAALGACNKSTQVEKKMSKAGNGARFDWTLVTTWPPNFPVFHEGIVRFASDVRTMSRGRLTIRVAGGGELVPPLETFSAVSQGTVQMGHGAAYYWAGKVPASPFFTAVPFGMNAQGMMAWLYAGGGLRLWEEIYEPYNLVPMPMGNTGVQMGGWYNKRIDSVADLKGLRMRIPGLGGKVMAKAGANPVLLPGAEIYTSLERNVIDAAEWVGPFHDERMGLYRAAKYYYYPGWQEPGPVLELIINRGAWITLPPDLQLMVRSAAADISQRIFAEFEAKNHEALQDLRKKYRVKILEYPPAVLRALRDFAREVLDEEAAKDATFRKVYDAYRAFRARHDAWSALSEEAYQRALKL